MKQRPRKPAIPRTAEETVRHALADLLAGFTLSAREISVSLRIAEKEIYSHLEHLRKSIHASGGTLEVTPPECRRCGFVFVKRDRLNPPGKCPVCRHEAITEPLFTIRLPQGRKDETPERSVEELFDS